MAINDLYYKAQVPLLYIYSAGSGLSAYRNPILGTIELTLGIPFDRVALVRATATLTNFFPTGLAYALVRDKVISTNDLRNGKRRNFDIAYGAACAALKTGANYIAYKFLGVEKDWQAWSASAASVLLTAVSGERMGSYIDTFKDGCGLPQNGASMFLEKRKEFLWINRISEPFLGLIKPTLDEDEKRRRISLANAISLGGLAAAFWTLNYQTWVSSLEHLVK